MNHSELLWFDSAVTLLYSVSYTWMVHFFCTSHFACARRHKKLYLSLLSIILALLNALSLSGILPYPVRDLIPLVWQIMLILWVILFYQGKMEQKILAASIFMTATLLLSNLVDSFLVCLTLVLLHSIHRELPPQRFLLMELPIFCAQLVCVLWGVVLLTKHTAGFFANRLYRWYVTLSAPLLAIILLWDCINACASHGILLRGGDHLNLYANQVFSHAGICILSALLMCGAGFYLLSMDRIDIEQKTKEQYRSQVAFYQMLEEQYRSLERLRHDMKNHIIGLQRLIDNREWDKTTDYLHKMAETGGIECSDDVSGKSVVDALLYYKRNQARKISACWECNVHIPPECSVDDFDLCVILGNLLNNALDACGKMPEQSEKFIRIHVQMVRKCLLVEITNSTEPLTEARTFHFTNHYNSANDSAYRSASRSVNHSPTRKLAADRGVGIGLQNVKDTIDRYNGILEIDVKERVFRVSVLLPCEPVG